MIKLFKNNKSLTVIFQTFMVTIPGMLNVGGLLLLFLYIYSILGVYLFAEVKMDDNLAPYLNFKNFTNAFFTMLELSSGVIKYY